MELQEINKLKEGFNNDINVKKALERLQATADFQLIFDKLFFLEDCARAVQLSANPRANEIIQKDSLAKAQSAYHLRDWFDMKIAAGAQAERDLHRLTTNPEEFFGEGEEI